MIEYTIRTESDVAVWACFQAGDFYHEVNILGLELQDIQPKLEEARDHMESLSGNNLDD